MKNEKYFKIKEAVVDKFNEDVDELSDLFDARIKELYKADGFQETRHAFLYYRSLLWEIRYTIQKNIK